MSIQHSTTVRNAKLDAIETAIGASPILRLRTGAPPANCAAADTGTVCATINLPADWLANASAGAKTKAGTWQDTSADAAGVIGHYRIYDSGGSVCHEQGTVGLTGSGADLTLDNNNVQPLQSITISSYALTEGNA